MRSPWSESSLPVDRVWRPKQPIYTYVRPPNTDVAQLPNNRQYLNLEESSAYLGTTIRHMRRLVAERRIPSYRVGKFVRFTKADLDQWMAEHRIEAR